MTEEKTGGPAFACAAENGHQEGMTLRDWFAGQALTGLCANSIPGNHHAHEVRVREAFAMADKMIEERSK